MWLYSPCKEARKSRQAHGLFGEHDCLFRRWHMQFSLKSKLRPRVVRCLGSLTSGKCRYPSLDLPQFKNIDLSMFKAHVRLPYKERRSWYLNNALQKSNQVCFCRRWNFKNSSKTNTILVRPGPIFGEYHAPRIGHQAKKPLLGCRSRN